MSPDPFRIQFLTITIDSQTVLTLVGLVVAGVVFRLAARREGLDLRAGHWWDVVTAAIIGGRLLWVATHLDYYLRGPLQVVVIVDGGLHPVGLVLGAAYAVRSLHRASGSTFWRAIVQVTAVAAVTAFLFERAGCALTTCGGGAPTMLPWALQRGVEWRQPLALYQVVVLGVALLLMTEVREVRGSALGIAFVAFTLIELISLALGARSMDGLLAPGVGLALYLVAVRFQTRQRAQVSPPGSPGAPLTGSSL